MKLLLMLGLLSQSFPGNGDWAAILSRYVNQEHRVDYAALRANRGPLEAYARQLAGPWPQLSPDARKAALINSYNALTIRWIVDNYPVRSIWLTKKPFTEARHMVDGKTVSLDDIEGELRKMDPRVHAVLVCAARSCPPLRREPYGADAVDRQLDENFREWLRMPDRNRFDQGKGTASISKIFDWYKADFERIGGVRSVLAKYSAEFQPAMKIEYQRYNWGLNDTSQLGGDYSDWEFYRDKLIH